MTCPSLAAWNIRGFNNPDKVLCCRNLVNEHRLDLICILENRINSSNLLDPWFCSTHKVFDNEQSFNNFEKASSGRIWIKWNLDKISFMPNFSSSQMISGHLMMGSHSLMILSAVYASNSFDERNKLWADLGAVNPQDSGNPIVSLYKKLKLLKREIKAINWSNSNLIAKKCALLVEKQSRYQRMVDIDPLNRDLCGDLKKITAEINYYNSLHASWIIQRSKINWLKNGEDDLKFLYSKIRNRKAFNGSSLVAATQHNHDQENSNIPSIIQLFQKLYNSAPPEINDVGIIPKGKTLSEEAFNSLVKLVTNEEIRLAINSGSSNSAPGPDGFNFDFYKKTWSITGPLVCKAIKSFFCKCYLPISAKATAIALVPKRSHAENLQDFRPISLCNVFHKIIAKILATRMKNIMPDIIEINQAAFIPNRVISDNSILAMEIINLFKKHYKLDLFCAKYDIRKAFDIVSRKFLFARMADKGFPIIFINWIKACINDIYFSICLDGSMEGFFSSSTGLRQGCPLSPFLFCIVMDALSCLLDHNSDDNGFEGFKMENFQLTHLSYADDLLVFGKAESNNCAKLMRTLSLFSKLTGLQLNLLKSSIIISPHVSNPSVISNELQIHNISTKFSYLGIPLSFSRNKITDFAPLLEKITVLLSGWKARTLSFAGRLQFIKYTIINSVAYWIRSMIIPKSIYKYIGKLCSKFLYHGDIDSKKIHLISWKNTCKPYYLGGLGIASFQALNFAYNCNTIMRCYNSISTLSKWLLARYSSPWKPTPAYATVFWKSICKTAVETREKFNFFITNNSPISILWDHWCLGNTIYEKIQNSHIDLAIDSQLASWINNGEWCIPDTVNSSIRNFILNMHIDNDGKKHIGWDKKENAKFKDFYLSYFANDIQYDWHQLVWHYKHAMRYSVYSWMALRGGLKTCDVLAVRNIQVKDNICNLCYSNMETISQMLFECDYSFNVLVKLIPSFQTHYFRPTVYLALLYIDNKDKAKKIKAGRLLILNAIIYHIWIERNNRRFKSSALCANSLIKKISKNINIKLMGWKNGIEENTRLPSEFPADICAPVITTQVMGHCCARKPTADFPAPTTPEMQKITGIITGGYYVGLLKLSETNPTNVAPETLPASDPPENPSAKALFS
ncbi:uncharacterized protein LOC114578859 [Dendrobium catenatum]|uniref:uncharacterized protein LOC114578859 n=1 Tax=Dendrobium catenatum TaxID=906689 RepID=UPI00109F4E58|nr:uncharacterized protein LOC114578859 [Dendrobium catenatum]